MAAMEGGLRPFSGRDYDLQEFWKKFQVIGKIQKWADGKTRMEHLPLYLTGDAFTVWSEMSSGDQEDEDKVKQALDSAFSFRPGEAYAQFVRRRKRGDESVDAYLADLRRLMRLSGHKESGDGKDAMLLEQFLVGLPTRFTEQLRLSIAASVGGVTVAAVAEQARALCTSVTGAGESLTVAATTSRSVVCYECQETGHLRRNCPQLRRGSAEKQDSGAGTRHRSPQCFKCKQFGHVKRNCPQSSASASAGSKSGGTTACSGDARQSSEDTGAHRSAKQQKASSSACLSATTAHSSVDLPRVFVHVMGSTGRWRAAVDSCSSRSLLAKETAEALGVAVGSVAGKDSALTAIDGEQVPLLGTVNLTISREDVQVHLPEVTAEFQVVKSLNVVSADLLIGIDIVSALGGVHLEYSNTDGELTKVTFGARQQGSAVAAMTTGGEGSDRQMPKHVTVTQDADQVTLTMADGVAVFDKKKGYWTIQWKWASGEAPTYPLGSGIGEYSRKELSKEQEAQFQAEVAMWIENGWLVPYNAEQHGPPGAVLPLLAVCQEHKATTPVRPCLDYRNLNSHIVSNPGGDAPVCGETIRKWRQRQVKSKVIDIRKAYLNVRVHPELQRFQMVVWGGQKYVMERMAFGLAVAPELMDVIVKWVTRNIPNTDNYIDDIATPEDQTELVAAQLESHGLPTKPPVDFAETTVLGLRLTEKDDQLLWQRRGSVDLQAPKLLTRRSVFQWCGKLTSHYPRCGWLRPAASWLKRVASEGASWDEEISPAAQQLCADLEARVRREDPVHGRWSPPTPADWSIFCDASSIAYGVVLQAGDAVMEDQCWLRPKDDKKHINVAELDAVVKGLNLTAEWNIKKFTLFTDSKTVYGWLRTVLRNTRRVKVSGLNQVVVERRLQIVAELVDILQLEVLVQWIPSERNPADKLTRVPEKYVEAWKVAQGRCDVVAAASGISFDLVQPPIQLAEIASAQDKDAVIQAVLAQVAAGQKVTEPGFQKVQSQLLVRDGLLQRSVKLPTNEVVIVPVLAGDLVDAAIRKAHVETGHGSREATWRFLHRRCYFTNMASKCEEAIQGCVTCAMAHPRRGDSVPPTRPVMPSGPWSTVSIDTLELGVSRSGRYHCVLVCVDHFTKWVEVVPLRRHDGASVASAFLSVCVRWGAPEVIRCDNGSEFVNAVVSALFDAFGVRVQHGAVRHPQSQGSVERFNKTLLTLVRKSLEAVEDWEAALGLLLYRYRVRPHSVTKVSPMEAMCGWEPRGLLLQPEKQRELSDSAWVDQLRRHAALVHDHIEQELSALDFEDAPEVPCPYQVGMNVLLRQSDRAQKRQPPYEQGWEVLQVIAPSTVRIGTLDGRTKIVNVDLLKRCPVQSEEEEDGSQASRPTQTLASDKDQAEAIPWQVEPNLADDTDDQEEVAHGGNFGGGYGLRDRTKLHCPHRFR